MRGSLALCIVIGSVWCALGLVTRPVAAEEPGPPTKPFLRIEAEMHTAQIRRIDVDRAGQRLVTASDDKTARIWDLKSGRLLRILRPPIGEGNEGKLFAVAFSPDGSTVAAGGFTSPEGEPQQIYLFDAKSGQIRGRLSGLSSTVNHLSYSKDGSLLAVALWGSNGIRVYRTKDLKLKWQDTDYGADSYSVEFDRRGRLVATCMDGDVRLYDRGFHLLARHSVPGGKQPFSARFSPNGRLVAVGFHDAPSVAVLDGATLTFRHAPDVSGLQGGDISSVGWSADGKRLYGVE